MSNQKVEPIYCAIGRVVTKLRLRDGLSQQQLGDALTPPVTRACIANIENANQRMLAHTLFQLAEFFGVPVAVFLLGPRTRRDRLPLGAVCDDAELKRLTMAIEKAQKRMARMRKLRENL